MNPYLLSALAIVAAYLIGAIPFGYAIYYAIRGEDIRTVGSGNIGATNVGRQLGFRFFVMIFVLDVAKGLLPTLYFPQLVQSATGQRTPDLPVLVALATILGHNFPVYLKFRGGKGVATSLGALFGLDWVASAVTLTVGASLVAVTRYVSLASLGGGLCFLAAHFLRTAHPWSPEERAMSALTIALVLMLFFRHRKNLERIRAGTEPRVRLRKPKTQEDQTVGDTPSNEPHARAGKVAWLLLAVVVIAGIGLAAALSVRASRPASTIAGPVVLTEVARAGTGHQRAERVAFADKGRVLAVTCPRYNRVVLYRVTERATLALIRDVELAGRPVAVAAAAAADRFYVLQQPSGDARHLEPGWWDTVDLSGNRIGSRFVTGFYPDDLLLMPDGRHALVLTSGRAEGGPHRPAPELAVVALDDGTGAPCIVGRLAFDGPNDDPARLTLTTSGQCAAVALWGSNQVASIDLHDLARPVLIARSPLPELEVPYPSRSGDDAILMPVDSRSEAVWAERSTVAGTPAERFVACTLPHESGLRLYHAGTGRALGELTLHGPLNLGRIRPTGLAFSEERGLFALANRSGGVHLIALRSRDDVAVPSTGLAATGSETTRR